MIYGVSFEVRLATDSDIPSKLGKRARDTPPPITFLLSHVGGRWLRLESSGLKTSGTRASAQEAIFTTPTEQETPVFAASFLSDAMTFDIFS